ncbi:MAG TPA: hypothetical protein VGN82_20180 [Bosea sp. (in: a-proteobacteria)]|uniref:hypothetical protein n=1 Tax=Bosea sp. (in: a-proteobacteria) TaxID=1871050 RepID=UPI002E0F651E|nr:hypothetical protein [Bosea sp. (in: a-proteobacteria)]
MASVAPVPPTFQDASQEPLPARTSIMHSMKASDERAPPRRRGHPRLVDDGLGAVSALDVLARHGSIRESFEGQLRAL